MECIVLSKFKPECTWFKGETAVRKDSRHNIVISEVKEGEFAVKLEITDSEVIDKGQYKLIAKNEKGEAVSQVVELTDIPMEIEKPLVELVSIPKYNFAGNVIILIHFKDNG